MAEEGELGSQVIWTWQQIPAGTASNAQRNGIESYYHELVLMKSLGSSEQHMPLLRSRDPGRTLTSGSLCYKELNKHGLFWNQLPHTKCMNVGSSKHPLASCSHPLTWANTVSICSIDSLHLRRTLPQSSWGWTMQNPKSRRSSVLLAVVMRKEKTGKTAKI